MVGQPQYHRQTVHLGLRANATRAHRRAAYGHPDRPRQRQFGQDLRQGGGGSRLSVIFPKAFLGGAPPPLTSLASTGGQWRRLKALLIVLIGAVTVLLAAFAIFRKRILHR